MEANVVKTSGFSTYDDDSSSLSVCIVGAGISGLSCATLLAEHANRCATTDVNIVVVDRNWNGGRSGVDDNGAEHCTRIVTGQYVTLLAFLQMVPAAGDDGQKTVADTLLPLHADRTQLLREDGTTSQRTILERLRLLAFISSAAPFTGKEWMQKMSFSEYIERSMVLDQESKKMVKETFQVLLARTADSFTAAEAIQILWCEMMGKLSGKLYHVFPGDTNKCLMKPWRTYLETRGVTFLKAEVHSLTQWSAEKRGICNLEGLPLEGSYDHIILATPLPTAAWILDNSTGVHHSTFVQRR